MKIAVTYENGVMYINYGGKQYETSDGVTVEPESFFFCEVKDNG